MSADTPARPPLPGTAVVLGAACAAAAVLAPWLGLAPGGEPMGRFRLALAVAGLATAAAGLLADRGRGVAGRLAELAADGPGLARFGAVALQLLLLVTVIQQFQLENPVFARRIMPLTLAGFVLHHLLAPRWRLPFFAALSLAGVIAALGVTSGGLLIALGLALIALCHLPVPFGARLALVLAAAAALAAVRTGAIPTSWGGVILPVLGSLFMFRLIVYLYDLRHGNAPVSPVRAVAYFFLLPNVVFPLFPVVDYAGFTVTYYNENAFRIYQRGIRWMLRGTVHLILYRWVNYHLVIGPEEVASGADLARYVLANFLLYLRVSGQFHLIIGMLLLFGFNLPETHHLYYLASSFSNFWRRINIYWKDFMQKLFFMPLFFRLKKRGGNLTAIVVATMITFLATWFLHAWQWFWLRGTYLFTAPDILFWTLLGVLVVANSLVENRRGPDRTLSAANPPLARLALLSVKTTATFAVICTLWSLWISESVEEWLSLWTSASLGPRSLAVGAGVYAAATAVLFGFYAATKRRGAPARGLAKPPPAPRALALSTLSIAALLAVGNPAVYFRLGSTVTNVVRDLRSEKLSARDAALLERGYYENLTVVNRFNSQLWEIYMQRPADWTLLQDSEAVRPTDDFLLHELRPDLDMMFKDAPLHTNRFGMRDRDYDETPAAGTCRIALIGGSHSMGSGVADDETFEAILEDRMNAENPGDRWQRYEVLNFAVGGYSDLHGPIVLEERALRFRPSAVFYIGHPKNTERLVHHLALRVEKGIPVPYPELQAMVDSAGAEAGMPTAEIERRLLPSGETIVRWALARMAAICREHDVLPVWIGIPSEAGEDQSEEGRELARWAGEAGFVAIDLSDVFGDVGPEELRVAPWDMHPNARGHRMIADGIWNALRARAADVPLGLF